MTDHERRADDEWRGQITEQVRALSRRIEAQDVRAGVLGESITSIRVDMSAMRSEQSAMRDDLKEVAVAVKDDAKARVKERSDLIEDLQDTLKQRGLNRFQIVLAIGGGLAVTIIGGLILLGITGVLSHIGGA